MPPRMANMTDTPQFALLNAMALPAIPPHSSTEFLSRDGLHFTVRPITPEDEGLMMDFHKRLSAETVYLRYFGPLRYDVRTTHERLARLCAIDTAKQIALVAIGKDDCDRPQLAAVGRMVRMTDMRSAEIAFLVADAQQHHGLGTYLLQRIIEIARQEDIARLEAIILAENLDMKDMLRRAGFKFDPPEMNSITAHLELTCPTA